MEIYSIYQDNSLRNYNYLLVCPSTREGVIIDPLDPEKVLALVEKYSVIVKYIINTHEHQDHIAGNSTVAARTGAKIIAHKDAPIKNVDRRVKAGDHIKVGDDIDLTVLDTPGHTLSHICLLAQNDNPPALFCGDTLFNAGCGNCHSGDVELLYKTFSEQLSKLSDNTNVYPGHDYLENNLRFAKTREPDNPEIDAWLEKAANHDPHNPLITTIAIEKKINPFFRLDSENLIKELQKDFPTLGAHPSEHDVFVRLRELRNHW
jgi:hydroxyacylglutathione hydrolase